MTPYVAEFINTLTNFTYVFCAFYGLSNGLRNKQDLIVLLTYTSLLGVGFGSIAAHGTLKYSCQVVDELAMIYTTALALYSVFSITFNRTWRWVLGTFLTTLVVGVTVLHLVAGESTLHQITFGLMIAAVGFRCRYLMRYVVKDRKAWASMVKLAMVGSITFPSGYGLWLVDVFACSTLQSWRRAVGMPFGFILELHGWWHILTCIGAYCYLVFVEYLRDVIMTQEGKRSRGLKLVWVGGVLPKLVATKMTDGTNGHVKTK